MIHSSRRRSPIAALTLGVAVIGGCATPTSDNEFPFTSAIAYGVVQEASTHAPVHQALIVAAGHFRCSDSIPIVASAAGRTDSLGRYRIQPNTLYSGPVTLCFSISAIPKEPTAFASSTETGPPLRLDPSRIVDSVRVDFTLQPRR